MGVSAGGGRVLCGWVYYLRPGCPSAEVEDLKEVLLVRAHLGECPAGPGASPGGRVDQHGFLDPGEGAQQDPHGHLHFVAWRRIRWAMARASTQVNRCTRMLCSV
jgi:hypothetical protein